MARPNLAKPPVKTASFGSNLGSTDPSTNDDMEFDVPTTKVSEKSHIEAIASFEWGDDDLITPRQN